MGIGAHAPLAFWRQFGQFRDEPAIRVEQLLCPVAPHPALELPQMLGMLGINEQRNLMRPEGSLVLQAVDHSWPRPALRRLKDDHGPARPRGIVAAPRIALDAQDLLDRPV